MQPLVVELLIKSVPFLLYHVNISTVNKKANNVVLALVFHIVLHFYAHQLHQILRDVYICL